MLVVRWNPWTGSIAQGLAYFLPDPVAPGLIPSIHKKYSEEKIVDVSKGNQRRCSEVSVQWLEDVVWTFLVLASGKLELEKDGIR